MRVLAKPANALELGMKYPLGYVRSSGLFREP
jgi:hypothetical protein